MSIIGLGILLALFVAPILVGLGLAALVRRRARTPVARALRPAVLFAGAATLAYTGAFSVAIFSSSSSTAAIAFLFLPFLQLALFGAALAIGWSFAALWARLRGASLAPMAALAAGVLALASVTGTWGLARYAALERRLAAPHATAAELRAAHADYAAHACAFRFCEALLARPEKSQPLARLVAHPETPEDVLVALARHPHGMIASAAVAHANLGADALCALAADPAFAARVALPRNPNAPPELLHKLAQAGDPWTDMGLVGHANLPEELRAPLFERLAASSDQYLRNFTAAQPNAPPHVLERLARDEWDLVRRTVAANWHTPLPVLDRLAEDPVENVRSMAAHMQEQRASER